MMLSERDYQRLIDAIPRSGKPVGIVELSELTNLTFVQIHKAVSVLQARGVHIIEIEPDFFCISCGAADIRKALKTVDERLRMLFQTKNALRRLLHGNRKEA